MYGYSFLFNRVQAIVFFREFELGHPCRPGELWRWMRFLRFQPVVSALFGSKFAKSAHMTKKVASIQIIQKVFDTKVKELCIVFIF
jgi:hypothetical protein